MGERSERILMQVTRAVDFVSLVFYEGNGMGERSERILMQVSCR
jgi:hypothetical protein